MIWDDINRILLLNQTIKLHLKATKCLLQRCKLWPFFTWVNFVQSDLEEKVQDDLNFFCFLWARIYCTMFWRFCHEAHNNTKTKSIFHSWRGSEYISEWIEDVKTQRGFERQTKSKTGFNIQVEPHNQVLLEVDRLPSKCLTATATGC